MQPPEVFNWGLRLATLFKKRRWHKCFPVNFAKFLRTSFSQNTTRRLLLNIVTILHPLKILIFWRHKIMTLNLRYWKVCLLCATFLFWKKQALYYLPFELFWYNFSDYHIQKEPPDVFNWGLRLATLFKKRRWHKCFPVNFAKFLRASFYRTPPDDCLYI